MDSEDISSEQKRLITLRNEYRSRQDWAKADEIRLELNKQNIGLKDTGADSIWFRNA